MSWKVLTKSWNFHDWTVPVLSWSRSRFRTGAALMRARCRWGPWSAADMSWPSAPAPAGACRAGKKRSVHAAGFALRLMMSPFGDGTTVRKRPWESTSVGYPKTRQSPPVSLASSVSRDERTRKNGNTARNAPRLSAEGGQTRDVLAQDQGVDLVGALVGPDGFQVGGVPQRGMVQRDAVAAQNRARLPGNAQRLPHVVQLAERDLLRTQPAGVLEPAQVQGQERALLDLQDHVHQLFLRQLVPGQRLAELQPLLGVGQRGLIGIPRGAHSSPRDPVPGLVEAGEGTPQSARRGQQRLGAQPDGVERDVALDGGAHRELLPDRRRGDARGAGRAEEAAYAVVGHGPHHQHARHGGKSDPAFRAVEDPARVVAGAVAAGEGLHRGRVRAGRGLGQGKCADQFAGGHPGEPLLLLVLGAPLVDGRHGEGALHGDERADARIAGLEFHRREAIFDGGAAGAAVALQVHAEHTELT